jgi:hypothetical protein
VLIPDDKGSLLPLPVSGVPVDEVEALHLARVPKIVGHRLVHAQRLGIHRQLVTQKTKSFALSYSQLRIYLVFTPTLGFPNTWFSSPQFGGFFSIFSLFTFILC